MQESLVEKLRKLKFDDYPDIHKYSRVEDYSLWVLLVTKEKLGQLYLSAHQIHKILTEVFGISVTTPGVIWALDHAKTKVHRKWTKKGKVFSIMQKGKENILHQLKVLIIEPEKAYSGIRNFQALIGGLNGNILICDPYIDSKTLDMLTQIPKSSPIKLLTCNPQNMKILKRDYSAYQTEYKNLEIRIFPPGKLHDRYIIAQNGMWLLGQSLNGIGKKETFVVCLGTDIKSHMISLFNANWSMSTKL